MARHPRSAPRRAHRFASLTLAALLVSGCQLLLPPELQVTPTALEFPATVATRSISVGNTGADGSLLRWTAEGSPRLTAWPPSGTLAAGEVQELWISVDRSGLTETTQLTVEVAAGGRSVEVTAIVDPMTTSGPAACDPDPELRYAGVAPWPLDVAAAAFASMGVEPTGVTVRWRSPSTVTPLSVRSVAELLPADATAQVTDLVPHVGGAFLATADPVALARRLSTEPNVRWVELDGPIVRPSATPSATPDDPAYLSGEQWWLDAFGFAEGRLDPSEVLADDVVVGVIDTGLRGTHEEHAGRFVPGLSFLAGVATTEVGDGDGHGTHVAGLLAATEGNGKGLIGLASHAEVRVQPVKVFDDSGSATIADLVTALRWVAGLPVVGPGGATAVNEAPVDVVNMSLGSPLPSADLRMAVIDARCEGVVLVAAAGNGVGNVGQDGGVDYPAAYPEVVSVGSVDESMERSTFSDYGEGLVDLMAPGGRPSPATETCSAGLWSSYHLADDAYVCLTGTSMATPLVAASAAVLIASDPGRYRGDPEAVESALRVAAARRPGVKSAEYGYGVLCLDALLTDTSVCGTSTGN